jgi:predicted nucleic acid-binding protein
MFLIFVHGSMNTGLPRTRPCPPTIIPMPESTPHDPIPHYFDTVTLSNFALCGGIELLVGRYGPSLFLTEQVRVELAQGLSAGYAKLVPLEDEVANGRISVATTMSPAEMMIFRELILVIGSGEAACIAMAKHRGGIVVTDDLLARRTCTAHGVPVTGTIGILKAMCIEGHIAGDAADTLLAGMVANGFHSPVRRISDLL